MGAKRTSATTRGNERGIALIAALLIMLLMSALMIGFTTVVMSDQRFRGIDKDRVRAFYGAQSGLEKLTVDVGNLFLTNVAPTNGQIAALANNPPTIPNVTFTAPTGVTAYGAGLVACDNAGDTTCNATIQTGPYQGLMALKKSYQLDVVAKTTGGGEAHLIRKIETVAIPVFQFGMFSNVDLAFFAGPNFNFGGRVHTNGNLFLAEGGGDVLTLTDKVTAVGNIVRQQLQNGVSISTAATHDGTISMATSTNTFRPLAANEGSVTQGLSPLTLNPNWPTISLTTYNGYIRDGATGAKQLNLPLITMGGVNTDLVRRPQMSEDTANPLLFGERMFNKVSLRILLSDTTSNITNLPTMTAAAPVRLAGDWFAAPPVGYGPVDATHPPMARSPGSQSFTANAAVGANNGNITVNAGAIPIGAVAGSSTVFHVPNWPLTLTYGAGLTKQVDCKTVTATTFTGCILNGGGNLPAVPIGSTFAITVDGVSYSAPTTVAQGAGTNLTYTFASTAPFATNQLWLTDAADPTPYLVTCTGVSSAAANAGNTTTSLTGCTGTLAGTTPTASTNALEVQNTSLVDGFLKIEMQDANNVWHDVTMEILNWGFSAPNQAGTICADPTPNAIIRFQRLKDNNNSCSYASSKDSYDYWPNALFDAREGLQRDVDPGNIKAAMGGVMNYVSLDVGNLSNWFQGVAPYGAGSGVNAYSNNGYAVYFSDRRNNVDAAIVNVDPTNFETGEYGFEDFVNPLSATGTPNGVLDVGEDVNGNGALDTYGQLPSSGGVPNTLPAGGVAPYDNVANVGPIKTLPYPQGMVNRTYLFRRALKLIDGGLGSIVAPGLTVVTENPAYIQGDWNANQAGFGNPHAETSVIADAVTLLSNQWTDQNSFVNPYNSGNRARNTSYYRVAVIAGKGPAFPWPNSGNVATDFGTDGGAHNFLRYLESGGTVNYQGAIATFYYNRQAVGTYKDGVSNTVYGAPTRNYNFDTDFLNPATLPPLTPVFRDVNVLGFAQEIRPGK